MYNFRYGNSLDQDYTITKVQFGDFIVIDHELISCKPVDILSTQPSKNTIEKVISHLLDFQDDLIAQDKSIQGIKIFPEGNSKN